MDLNEHESKEDINILASEIVGGAAGGGLGFLIGGPLGAILGGAGAPLAAKILIQIAQDLKERFLSPREETRIAKVIAYTAIKIRDNDTKGLAIRNDGFFQGSIDSRSAAEEIFEGVLMAAQREHEERKLPFLGNLFGNIAFDQSIDKEQANLLVRLGKDISFRQLCILSVFSNKNKPYIIGRFFDSKGFPYTDMKANFLFQEIFNLGSQGLLYCSHAPVTTASYLSNPGQVEIVGAGYDLYRLMELERMEVADLDRIASMVYPNESAKYPPKRR